ncbi:MAG: hypothetical protein COA43_05380 [Robiginitomaculum sp.]|nr:MAG: hypothetical protein COA43_05380 [Robiginitomaculum sp.]
MPNFNILSTATTVLALSLSLLLAFTPQFIFWLFSLTGNEAAYFISRRAAIMFLGIAVLAWLGRKSAPSSLRQAVCLGMGVMMIGLALLGLGEFARGYTKAGILLAVTTEFMFGFAYVYLWKKHS